MISKCGDLPYPDRQDSLSLTVKFRELFNQALSSNRSIHAPIIAVRLHFQPIKSMLPT